MFWKHRQPEPPLPAQSIGLMIDILTRIDERLNAMATTLAELNTSISNLNAAVEAVPAATVTALTPLGVDFTQDFTAQKTAVDAAATAVQALPGQIATAVANAAGVPLPALPAPAPEPAA